MFVPQMFVLFFPAIFPKTPCRKRSNARLHTKVVLFYYRYIILFASAPTLARVPGSPAECLPSLVRGNGNIRRNGALPEPVPNTNCWKPNGKKPVCCCRCYLLFFTLKARSFLCSFLSSDPVLSYAKASRGHRHTTKTIQRDLKHPKIGRNEPCQATSPADTYLVLFSCFRSVIYFYSLAGWVK